MYKFYISAEPVRSIRAGSIEEACQKAGLKNPVIHQDGCSAHEWRGSSAHEIVEA